MKLDTEDETSPLYIGEDSRDTGPTFIALSVHFTFFHFLLKLIFYFCWYLPTRYAAAVLFYVFTHLHTFFAWIMEGVVAFVGRRQNLGVRHGGTEEENVPSISFAGGGMTWVYYLGVAHYLHKNYDYTKMKILCSSCGCFGGIPLALGLDPYDWCSRDWKTCLNHFSSRMMGPLLDSKQFYYDLWDAYLPEDAHIALSGRIFISITLFPSFQNKVVSQFPSRDELISTICASICFPIVYMRNFPSTMHGLSIDGGLTNDQPCFNKDTITVSSLNKNADIHPEVLFTPLDVIRVPDFSHVWFHSKIAFEDASKCLQFNTESWKKIQL